MTMRSRIRVVLPTYVILATAYVAGAEPLTIQGDNYPRVFYFRATERACSPAAFPTYESWERNFDGLMGIMGKCLEEECLGRLPRAPQFFTCSSSDIPIKPFSCISTETRGILSSSATTISPATGSTARLSRSPTMCRRRLAKA